MSPSAGEDPGAGEAREAAAEGTALPILVVIGAGVVGALQVGKGVIALPLLKAAMDLSLVEASAIVSVFAVFSALAALPAGVAVPRLGARRAFLAGLVLMTAGSALGAAAGGFAALLATRVLEGAGFLLVITSGPVLLARLARAADRDLVFAAWGGYMPLGMGLMILSGAAVAAIGWQALWILNAVLAGGWLLLALRLPAAPPAEGAAVPLRREIARTLARFARDRLPFLVAATFFAYGLMYYALVALLPAFLVQAQGTAVAAAGLATAVVAFANAAGNPVAGVALKAGVPFARLVAASYLPAAALSAATFVLAGGPVGAAVLAGLAAGVMGTIPGACMALAPRLARERSEVGAVIGLFMQFTAVAQFLAPPAFALVVDAGGWSAAPAWFGCLALAAAALLALTGRIARLRAASGRASGGET